MERKIPLLRVLLVIASAIVINLCYYLGIGPTLKFCVDVFFDSAYAILVGLSLVALVASVTLAVTSAITEVTWGGENVNGRRVYARGWLAWESFVISMVAVAFSSFMGEMSSWIARNLERSYFYAELLRFENLFPVFWKPYLAAYAISLLLALLLWGDRKYRTHKRKKRKKA